MKRELAVHDTEAHEFVDFLVNFLGQKRVFDRIRRAHRVISLERGNYLEYWVRPIYSFWLGLEAAMAHIKDHGTLAEALSREMFYPIELAAKLRHFSRSMPEIRLNEFRSRILTSDYLPPVFLEIDTAAHYWQLGYEIEWPSPPEDQGIRISEFIASEGAINVEVECKSQAPDSGRMVARPRFYRLTDEITALLASLDLAGKVLISVPARLPTSDDWKNRLLAEIRGAALAGSTSITLDDSTIVEISLSSASSFLVPVVELLREAAQLQVPHSQVAISGSRNNGSVQVPVIVRFQSTSPDRVLASYLEDLRDANRQLSGTRPGVIVCFVPEVQSFEGLQSESALHNMTAAFFQRHAKESVYAVSYVSDSTAIQEGLSITRSSPAIAFHNHLFDNSLGENIPILSGSQPFSGSQEAVGEGAPKS
jgi:hypothetical protein